MQGKHKNIVSNALLVSVVFLLSSKGLAQDTGMPPLDSPRVERIQKPYSAAEAAILVPRTRNGNVLGVWSTCANSPALCNAWLEFTDYLLQESTLPIRDRELLILRIGYLNQGAYEWAAHRGLALSVGISEQELRAITIGSTDPRWSGWDASLLRAAEELHLNALVSDETWAELSTRYTKRQMMETVFTVGQYNMVAMYLNSLGVQFEEDWIGYPID
ncbi:MAG: carboxymuconolactone decarboxylase family protein [Gammaproteobacteria bacterium]|nr:carboxymuconolactone decarboxylase family protein [Gammaproteobacteria bacterium]